MRKWFDLIRLLIVSLITLLALTDWVRSNEETQWRRSVEIEKKELDDRAKDYVERKRQAKEFRDKINQAADEHRKARALEAKNRRALRAERVKTRRKYVYSEDLPEHQIYLKEQEKEAQMRKERRKQRIRWRTIREEMLQDAAQIPPDEELGL